MTTRAAIRTASHAVYVRLDGYPSFVLDFVTHEVVNDGPEAALARVMSRDWVQVLQERGGDPDCMAWEIPNRDNLPWDLAYVYDVDHRGVVVWINTAGDHLALKEWGRWTWDKVPFREELEAIEQASAD